MPPTDDRWCQICGTSDDLIAPGRAWTGYCRECAACLSTYDPDGERVGALEGEVAALRERLATVEAERERDAPLFALLAVLSEAVHAERQYERDGLIAGSIGHAITIGRTEDASDRLYDLLEARRAALARQGEEDDDATD